MKTLTMITSFGISLILTVPALAQRELIVNGGFETGSFPPWIPIGNWNIGAGGHLGNYCAQNYSTGDLRQNISPTPARDILSASFWLKTSDDDLYAFVKFYYSTGDSSQGMVWSSSAGQWGYRNVTSLIAPSTIVTGMAVGGPGLAAWIWIDDVSILMNTVPPSVSITLIPHNPPITIPASGGLFNFWVDLVNPGTTPAVVDVWTAAYLPTGVLESPIFLVENVEMAAGGSMIRLRTQYVPAFAPPGHYLYCGFVGDYPAVHLDSSYFGFTKLTTGDGSLVSDWSCIGEPFPGEATIEVSQPSQFILSASPNPFNPSTFASFELRVPSHVGLQVYDTAGRLVKTLVDGWRAAGKHQAIFDGSNLPSGIYLARITAGDWSAAQKLVLLK